MFQRIWHMLIKEFIQVLRDPRMRGVVFVIPCVQVLVIGYAVTMDVRNVRTAVRDYDNSVESRELLARLMGSGYFQLVESVDNERRSRELLDRGLVTLLVAIDHGFGEDLRAGRTARLQLILDGTDSNTAGIVMAYASRITAAFSDHILLDRFARRAGAFQMPSSVQLQTRAWFNENLDSRNFFVPGVIAIVVTLATLLLTSMAVVREKEIGTIEQIMVTPITPWEFILGKTVPFAVIGLVDVVLVTTVGVFWFQVPIRGSLLMLFGCTALYLLTTLGVGLFISTVCQTQQQAMMSTFFFFFPAMLLSGFVFPVANMPQVVQWFNCLNPLRFYLVTLRGIFLKGNGLDILWPEVTVLAVMGLTTMWLAARRFHKTL